MTAILLNAHTSLHFFKVTHCSSYSHTDDFVRCTVEALAKMDEYVRVYTGTICQSLQFKPSYQWIQPKILLFLGHRITIPLLFLPLVKVNSISAFGTWLKRLAFPFCVCTYSKAFISGGSGFISLLSCPFGNAPLSRPGSAH